MSTINITPDPRILEVITHNPMSPINALCELIDNSIDSLSEAGERNISGNNRLIEIELPGRSDIDKGISKIVIRDGGIGLSREDANNAVKAGFSGNEAIGRLGLFGMGFNISTGKLGKKTIFKTARKEDNVLLKITIDLEEIRKQRTFDVPVEECPKPQSDYSGVTIEISDWWEAGNQNYGFVKKLVGIGVPKLTEQIGRRYSTLLRKGFSISINRQLCPVFHHCVWSKDRYVERRSYGKIPARFDFNQIFRVEKRCYTCGNSVDSEENYCSRCGPEGHIKARDCSIKGWVGIQRFDDANNFGIDFIRNGRAILIEDKEAVFTWTPEKTGVRIKEYPQDGIYGRIVGEIHMDHVPTDFLKTDFQRTSPEWAEVIKYLRGESSLLPETQQKNNEPENSSPIYKLVRGYHSVRNYGRKDMYMGYWDDIKGEPARITRAEEKELYDKFLKNESGYGPKDDSGWWALVERAETRPVPEMKDCPICGVQVFKEAEICPGCGFIYKAKKCIKCSQDIAVSELKCHHCGANQIPEEEQEWVCKVCLRKNPPAAYKCRRCDLPRGVEDPLKVDFLKENSVKVDALSVDSFSIKLPDNISMSSMKLITNYVNKGIVLQRGEFRVPAVFHSISNEINIFIDQSHPIYNKYQGRPEDIISIEIAKWIWLNYQGSILQASIQLWSPSNLYYLIHSEVWKERVELDSDQISTEVKNFFNLMGNALPDLLKEEAQTIYENMDEKEQSIVIEQLYKNNLIERREELVRTGEYLSYLPADMLISVFDKYPDKFFDGKFWKDPYERLNVPDSGTLEKIKKETVGKYQRCLEDMISFIGYRIPDINYIRKIGQTLRMVRENMLDQWL